MQGIGQYKKRITGKSTGTAAENRIVQYAQIQDAQIVQNGEQYNIDKYVLHNTWEVI